jgi:amino acid adenylation domain-containing protein
VRYDAAFTFSGSADQLEVVLEYRADLLDDQIARWVVSRFETFLAAALANPAQPLRRLHILGPQERVALESWQGDDLPVQARSLPDLIHDMAARFPRRPAVEVGERAISFAELWSRGSALGDALSDRGVRQGDLVAIALGHSIDWVVAVLGSWLAGAAFVPIDPTYPAERRSFMLQDSASSVVLTDTQTAAQFDGLEVAVICVDASTSDSVPAPAPTVAGSTTAYLIYTSGSTGRPKGTVVTHASLAGLTRALDSVVHLGRDASLPFRVSVNAPISFDASIKQLLHLGLGCTLVPIPDDVRIEPARFIDYLQAHPVDLLDATPIHLRQLVDAGLFGSRPPQTILIGGEPIDAELWATLAALDSDAWNVYGPTEVTVDAVVARVAATPTPVIGRPLPGLLVRVVDPARRRVPVGVDGELWLAGTQVAAGYHRRPELSSERFLNHDGHRWYRTGDIVRYRADGQLEYRGRDDDQVKVRGHRVELGEVAAALRSLPAVDDAAALVREGDLVGWVVPSDASTFDSAVVRHELRAKVPGYLVPSKLVTIAALPLLPSGKLDKTALAAAEVQVARTRDVEPPNGPAEELIAELWAGLLDVATVSADDDFFDLGGDSLSASRFVSQLRALGIELPLMAVFTNPTVRGLADPLTRILLDGVAMENPGL